MVIREGWFIIAMPTLEDTQRREKVRWNVASARWENYGAGGCYSLPALSIWAYNKVLWSCGLLLHTCCAPKDLFRLLWGRSRTNWMMGKLTGKKNSQRLWFPIVCSFKPPMCWMFQKSFRFWSSISVPFGHAMAHPTCGRKLRRWNTWLRKVVWQLIGSRIGSNFQCRMGGARRLSAVSSEFQRHCYTTKI